MGGPGQNLHVREQRGVVEGGGHLADAAAHHVHQLPALVAGSGQVALVGGALTQGIVEGEGLAGVDDYTVESLAGKLQIGGPVAVSGVGGPALSQHIPVELALIEDVRLYGPHGDTDRLAVIGPGHGLRSLLQIEVVAIGAGDNPGIGGVHTGVYGGDIEFIIDLLQIQGLGLGFVAHIGDLHGEPAVAVGVQNQGVDLVGVDADAGLAHGDDQGLAGGGGVKLVGGKLRPRSLQAVGGLGQGVSGVQEEGVQYLPDILVVQGQVAA